MPTNFEFEDITTNDSQFNNNRVNKVRDRLNGTSLRVGGAKFKIGTKGRLLERFDIAGQTDFYNDTILLDSNMTEGNTLSTLVHEAIECVNKKYNMGLPHELIGNLEAHLFTLLVDNPSLLKELLQYSLKINGQGKRSKKAKK